MKKHDFADRLRKLLKQKGLTLAQVAGAIGTSAPSVHRWTRGGEIEYENLRALASFLEVNWIWLRYGDDAIASLEDATPNGGMTDLRREYLSQIMENEARMKAAQEMAQIVNWEWNVLTGALTHSENAELVFGQSPESIRTQLIPFEQMSLDDLVQEFGDTEMSHWDFSLVQQNDGNKEKWFTSRAQLLFDSQRRPIKIVAVSADISERKKIEQALERSEYMMRKIIETIPVGLWAADESGRICLANPEVERIWGGAKFVGLEHYGEYKGWWEKSGQEVGPGGWTLARAVNQGETSEAEIVNIEAFDGQRRTIIMYATPLFDAQNKIIGAIEVNQDITDLKNTERSLKQSLEQWNILFDQPLIGVICFDEEYRVLRANHRASEMTNIPDDVLHEQELDSLFDSETCFATHAHFESLSDQSVSAFKLEGKLRNADKGSPLYPVTIYFIHNPDHNTPKALALIFKQ